MRTIDITEVVLRDSDKNEVNWIKPYVDWLVENVGMQIHFEPGTAMDQGKGWKLYQRIHWSEYGVGQQVCVDIDDPRLANFFALRWL